MVLKHTDPRKVKYFEDRAEFLLRHCKPEDRADFVLQTFLELSKDGWNISTNGRVATSLEKMMQYASIEATGCLLKTFTKELEPIFYTKFAHHVLHATLRHCVTNPELRQDELISSCINDYLDFMWDNYATFLQHSHAAPALRVYLQLLSGVYVTKSPHTGLYEVDKVTIAEPLDPTSYIDRITNLTNQFLLSDSFNTFVLDPMSCAFLQILIIVCWKRLEENFEAICSNILRKSHLLKVLKDAEVLELCGKHKIPLPMGFSHSVAVFFLETLISLLPGRLLQKLLHNHIIHPPSLEGTGVSYTTALASHGNACRVLRATVRALKRVSDLKEVMSALQLPGKDETETGLGVALLSGQHYLLIALAEACRRCTGRKAESVQATFEQMLLDAFGYPMASKKPNDQLIKSIVQLRRHVEPEMHDREEKEEGSKEEDESQGSGEKTACKLAGCLLAEEMLGFTAHRPTRLAASLASLAAPEMVSWARNHMLHRVIETALLSPSVPDQRKLQIFGCLKSQLGTIAMDQSGSRVVEALWRSLEASTSKPTEREVSSMREEIARLLAPVADRLENSKFGRFVEKLVGSGVYRSNPQRWRQVKLADSATDTAKDKVKKSNSSMKRHRPPTEPQKHAKLSKKQKR